MKRTESRAGAKGGTTTDKGDRHHCPPLRFCARGRTLSTAPPSSHRQTELSAWPRLPGKPCQCMRRTQRPCGSARHARFTGACPLGCATLLGKPSDVSQRNRLEGSCEARCRCSPTAASAWPSFDVSDESTIIQGRGHVGVRS